MVFHVSKIGKDNNRGDENTPFLTISKAAATAVAGDIVVVHEGVYREWVKPNRGGNRPDNRITYKSADGDKVTIKGSEIAVYWEHVEGKVYKHVVKNNIFGDYNPYATEIDGDWMIDPKEYRVHTGDVYLNGKSMYEAASLNEVITANVREGVIHSYSGALLKIADSLNTVYRWYAEVAEEETIIYANFNGVNPNNELVEINVRKCCFFPEKTGLDYITVSGFEMAHAATPWAPPTAYQFGMLGVNWSKGWIIENNILHDAKCSAISLGKEGSTGDQEAFIANQKSGYLYQKESVFKALQHGWSRETIGSHLVKNNKIYDCGQNGIVGHMGCIFSRIEGNHIYNIGTKREFFGWEIAGIKFHAPIDTVIEGNRIHNCTLAFWLDWQAQGTRVTRNLCYDNDCDGNIEVTHGPMLVDNNVMLSPFTLTNHAQGTAFINNLFCGCIRVVSIFDRSKPYHFPHSTKVAGTAFVYTGDDSYYNNIFVGTKELADEKSKLGTIGYNGHPSSKEEYNEKLNNRDKGVDHSSFMEVKQPVFINNNIYLNGSLPYENEQSFIVDESFDPCLTLTERDGSIYLDINLPNKAKNLTVAVVDTKNLNSPRISNAGYEDSNGKTYKINHNYFNILREDETEAGPIEFTRYNNSIKVW